MRFNWIRWLALAVDWNQRIISLDDENGVIGVGHFLWSRLAEEPVLNETDEDDDDEEQF